MMGLELLVQSGLLLRYEYLRMLPMYNTLASNVSKQIDELCFEWCCKRNEVRSLRWEKSGLEMDIDILQVEIKGEVATVCKCRQQQQQRSRPTTWPDWSASDESDEQSVRIDDLKEKLRTTRVALSSVCERMNSLEQNGKEIMCAIHNLMPFHFCDCAEHASE
jgi:hypothetical protein